MSDMLKFKIIRHRIFAALILTAVITLSFASQASASILQRGDEATFNSGLIKYFSDTWHPYVWNWNMGDGWPVDEDQYSYVHWESNGLVTMRCEDHGGYDGIFLATNFDQGNWNHGLKQVDLANTENLWLEASTQTPTGPTWLPAWDWTGVKFDVWIHEKNSNRQIMMEMYYWRTGMNTLWDPDCPRQTDIGSETTWNYMVALDGFRYYWEDTFVVEWDADGQHHFAINVYGLLRYAAIPQLNSIGWPYRTPNPPFNIDDFNLTTVCWCCEAGNNGGIEYCPMVSATLHSLRIRYDTFDVNGDGVVDISDFNFVCEHYGATIGLPGYDFRADLDSNGVIEYQDAYAVYIHQGLTY